MGLLIAAAALLAGFGAAYVASDEVRYLSRAGIEETRLLTGRTPISVIAADSSRPDSLRRMAGLVLGVRAYAVQLGLEAGETYTTYTDVGRDTLLLVLTASPRTCLCPVTWKYPVAGRVPYKGFFDFAQAQARAEEYRKESYDVNLRPSAAFSTLGWFNDPLLSTALSRDSVYLATLVFHEIAHNTLWVKSATAFNESFAQWVAYRAAQQFFWARQDTTAALRAADEWRDEMVLDDYYRLLMGKLDSLYALRLPAEANDSGRAAIARWTRDTMAAGLGPQFVRIDASRMGGRPINNAQLLGVRLYRTNLHLFEAWSQAFGNDLYRALHELRDVLEGVDGEAAAFRRMTTHLQARGALPADTLMPSLPPDSTRPSTP